MYVVFIHGPAAAGKHTIGSAVAEQLGLPLFHNHLTVDLASSLFEFGSDPFCRLRADVWRTAFRECARACRSFVFTFHPEATVAPAVIDDLARTVTEGGGAMFFVELLCSREAILGRLQNESRKQFGKLTDPALYASIEAQGGFAFEGLPPPDLQIDTESLAPARAAEVIVAAVRRRLAAGPAGPSA